MNARDIQRALILDLHQNSALLLPNYTPRDWWECDIFRATKAGYWYEYEIKLTKSDFKADAKKESGWRYVYDAKGWQRLPSMNKHACIDSSNEFGPKQFSWVVPRDMIKPEDVPEWSGLIYAEDRHSHIRLKRVKKAPQFRRRKLDDSEIALAHRRIYGRYIHLFLEANKKAPPLGEASHTAMSPRDLSTQQMG